MVGRAWLWLIVSTELEGRKWLLKSLTSSLLLLQRSRRLLGLGNRLKSLSPPAAPAREGAALLGQQQHRIAGGSAQGCCQPDPSPALPLCPGVPKGCPGAASSCHQRRSKPSASHESCIKASQEHPRSCPKPTQSASISTGRGFESALLLGPHGCGSLEKLLLCFSTGKAPGAFPLPAWFAGWFSAALGSSGVKAARTELRAGLAPEL